MTRRRILRPPLLRALPLVAGAVAGAALVGAPGGASGIAETVTLQLWSGEQGIVRARSDGVEHVCRFEEQHPEKQDLCVLTYATDAEVMLVAEPVAGGDEFAAWSVPECPGRGECVVRMDDSRSVFATFGRVELLVLALGPGSVRSEPAGIDCRSPSTTQNPGANCRGVYPSGTVVRLTATPDAGEAIRWGVGCDPVGDDFGSATCVARAESHFVTVGFGREPPGLLPFSVDVRFRVAKQGDGAGTVSDDGNIDCPAVCTSKTAEYEYGRRVTLQATASPGSLFRGWVEPTGRCGTSATCRLPVGMPVTSVAARFATPLVATLRSARAVGTGARRTVRARVTVNREATCRLRLVRRTRIVAKRNCTLRAGTNALVLRVPRRAPAGRYRLVIPVRDATGQSRSLSLRLKIPR